MKISSHQTGKENDGHSGCSITNCLLSFSVSGPALGLPDPVGTQTGTPIVIQVAVGPGSTKEGAPTPEGATEEGHWGRALEDKWSFLFGEVGTTEAKAQGCGMAGVETVDTWGRRGLTAMESWPDPRH